jgi:hypothetical protein
MNRIAKLATAMGILIVLIAFFVPDPDLYALPTGFCALYGSPTLQCSHSTYFSLTKWYFGFGTFYIGGHYFLELGSRNTIQIF